MGDINTFPGLKNGGVLQKITLGAGDILALAINVADAGGFCLCQAVGPDGVEWRIALLPSPDPRKAACWSVQAHVDFGKEQGWKEDEGFYLLSDACDLFLSLVGQKSDCFLCA